MHGQVKKNKKARDLGRTQRHRIENGFAQRLVGALNGVHPVSRRSLTPGTVVEARVPYYERDGSKVRPALVIGCRGDVVVLRVFTSKEWNARRHGGGVEVFHNGLRSWVVNHAIELDRMDILQVTAKRYDELAFATAA
jgi:hypothetical protein